MEGLDKGRIAQGEKVKTVILLFARLEQDRVNVCA